VRREILIELKIIEIEVIGDGKKLDDILIDS